MSLFKRGKTWWCEFWFTGRRVQESTKTTSKTVVKLAEQKSINEEVGFLLRLLGERGEVIRARSRKQKTLKLKGSKPIAKAYSPEEKQRLMAATQEARSPTIYPVLMLALNAGMRNGKIRNLRWDQVDLKKQFLSVGKSKTEAGEGRTIPLNPSPLQTLKQHANGACYASVA